MQISCTSSSDELSDRVRFPYYFQLLPSEVNLARVFYSIIKEYGWRRVALIVQNEYRYRAVSLAPAHVYYPHYLSREASLYSLLIFVDYECTKGTAFKKQCIVF